jgi:HD-like signal output (HDOD) protein
MLKLFKGTKKDPRKTLEELLGDYDIPSFPDKVMGVMNLMRDPESTMREIADRIEIDPGLHVKVLRTVNSAAFGLAAKVTNILHAVSLLGRSRLESLVLSVAVKDVIPHNDMEQFDAKNFWKVAMRRASLARILSDRLHPAAAAEAFTVGLLQDMGIPVLVNVKKDAYCELFDTWNGDGSLQLCELERQAFGFDHTMVGALMAQKWDIPSNFVDAIAGHHASGEDAGIEPAIRLSSFLRYGSENDGVEETKKVCVEEFGFQEAEAAEIIDKAFTDAGELNF